MATVPAVFGLTIIASVQPEGSDLTIIKIQKRNKAMFGFYLIVMVVAVLGSVVVHGPGASTAAARFAQATN